MRWVGFAVVLCGLSLTAAAGQTWAETVDPLALGIEPQGPKTQVLVLGSTHLSAAPDTFDTKNLDHVLAKLSAFAPKVVAVEYLSGESLDALERYEGVYPDVANTYGKSIRAARDASGPALSLTIAQAEKEARRLLASLPASPGPAERRKLAATFAAAGEFASAAVQWMQLPEKERRAADGVTEALLPLMEKWTKSRNEALAIGARVAARMKLDRVYAVDDHSADDVVLPIEAALQAYMDSDPKFKTLMSDMQASGILDVAARMTSPQAVLEAYRFLNDPETLRKDVSLQWGYFLRLEAPERLGRRRMAEWEARNLRMTANLREAFAHHPGERVLFVVGASHKPYIEAYLNQMHDVEIVDALAVLK